MLIRNLIKQATKVGNSENTIRYIEYLYQFEKFRNTLNLTLSLIKQNRLSFEIYQEGSTDAEEGLCKTIRSSGVNRYVIILRRSNPYIIVHELSHMIENELSLNLAREFIHTVYRDMEQNFTQSNILVQMLVNQVIFKEIQVYQSIESRASELFARYFELFAWAQEIYPRDRKYLIRTRDLDKVFINTNKWKKNYLDPKIMSVIDNEVKEYNNKTNLKDTDKIQTSWTNKFGNRRIRSIFEDSN
ncbi:MAG: hypothetical protein QWI36_01615 [Wolbachia endosymbiont of Tyrophagus putrescentiae]|nr:hypothetical protein [Wolbachia endosymbiont of Tyrophagus putrescentiae]